MGFGSRIVADDFLLDDGATLTSASLPFYHTGGEWLGSVLYWYLYADSQGVPGGLLASGEGENVATRALGSDGYNDIFEVTFDLDQSVQLDAGVVYWLGLHNPGGFVPVGLSWGAADMSGGNTYFKFPPDGAWSPAPVEMSFQLLPEPSAELLGLTALLALGMLAAQRRRRVS